MLIPISFPTAVNAIVQVFLMGLVGYVIARYGVLTESGLKLLSFLSINIIFPLFIFNQIITYFDPKTQPDWWWFPFINIGLCLGGFVLVTCLMRLLGRGMSSQWKATTCFHNAGYIPLLLITALPLGDLTGKLYAHTILSIVGFDVCLWSLGVWLITQDKKGITYKNFLNPPLISMMSAFIVVLLGLKGGLPSLLMHPVKVMGDSALAIAMITIGGNLALTSMHQVKLAQLVPSVLVKLVALPLITLGLIKVFHWQGFFPLVLMIQSCMPTAVTLSVIARHQDSENQDIVNQAIFYSHLFCVFTIPVFLGLYGILCQG